MRLFLFDAFTFRSVNSDIRVRIDGVEEEHGLIKVNKNGKVCNYFNAPIFEYCECVLY